MLYYRKFRGELKGEKHSDFLFSHSELLVFSHLVKALSF